MAKQQWTQVGKIITNGEHVLNVGDVIQYQAFGTDYKGKWRLIGATDKGELIIMSENSVGKIRLEGKSDYLNGAKRLNDFCRAYGRGRGASRARSIEFDDVDKIKKYDELKELLFGKYNDVEYWLATFHVSSKLGGYGMFCVKEGSSQGEILHGTSGYDYAVTHNVRAIVFLGKSIELSKQWVLN